MATDFQMPKLGLTMEEGTILEWLVPDGADVAEGAAVLRIETDKVETDVELPLAGRLYVYGTPGESYPCGAVIGVVVGPGEEAPVRPAASSSTPTSAAGAGAPGQQQPAGVSPMPSSSASVPAASVASTSRSADGRLLASPNARRVAAERGIAIELFRGSGPGGRIVSEDVEAQAAAIAAASLAPRPSGAESFVAAGAPVIGAPATAAARQLADLLGVDLAAVAPDATDGRVTREAVAHHVRILLTRLAPPPAAASTAAPKPAGVPAVVEAPAAASQTPTRTIRLSGMRGTIAKRMQSSLQQMAQLTLTMDAEMDAVVADRQARRGGDSPVPSYTDYVVAAVAQALAAHPGMNAQVTPDGIALLPDVHVGLAVALPDGLLVPVVRHADQLDLAAIAAETSRLASGARAGGLPVSDYEGSTFSVTALGSFGVDAFTPVINPPNAGILGVGRLRSDVVLRDGAVATAQRLTLSLTWDHRVLDGAPAAEFCRAVVAALGDPASLDHR